ncbi:MAG: Lrp/AsnC ligand binding domain-containing protein [Candidatus Methylomirabilales bacterium]
MVRAYIFVEALKAHERQVADEIRGLPGVTHADVVTGHFDVVVQVQVADLGLLWDTVDRIQALAAVTKTTTNLIVEPYDR